MCEFAFLCCYDCGPDCYSSLLPRPSGRIDDPLNWSRIWKCITFASQLIYVWVLVTSALSLAPLFPLLAEEFGLNDQQVSLLTGVNVITLGFANLLIIPLSNLYGRRPICILCGFLVVLTNVWQALATSYQGLLAARAVNGIVAATAETVMVQVIADIFFLHERGLWVGLYFTLFSSGAFLGPIIAGNMAIYGWRSFMWLSVAMAAFSTLLLVFAFPETVYYRTADSTGNNSLSAEVSTSLQDENLDLEANNGQLDDYVGRGKPSKHQFIGIQMPPKKSRLSSFTHDLITPFLVFFNPIIFWSAMMLASAACLVLLYNLTQSSFLSTYGWSPAAVGYSNFSFFVGCGVGALTAGPFSDWLMRHSTARNNGIREAEMRLPALIPFICIYIVSNVIGAVGYDRRWPWQVIVICGFGFSGASMTSIPTIAISYALDSYSSISGEIMVVGTVMKNVLGFSLSYWIFDVQATAGWLSVFMVQFAVSMFSIMFALPLYVYGKHLRRWTKDSKIHKIEVR